MYLWNKLETFSEIKNPHIYHIQFGISWFQVVDQTQAWEGESTNWAVAPWLGWGPSNDDPPVGSGVLYRAGHGGTDEINMPPALVQVGVE